MSTETEMRGLGFHKAGSTEYIRRLIISVDGHEKQGKSHFALTAPQPIALFDVDTGLEGVVEKFDHTKGIFQNTYRYRSGLQQIEYEKLWDDFVKAHEDVLNIEGVRTIVWDTASELWELIRLARFGKLTQVKPFHYGPVNAEFRELVRKVYDTDKNMILVHKRRKKYVDDMWKGGYERAGFTDMGFLVQANTTIFRDPDSKEFTLHVTDCRQNMEIADTDLAGVMCSFQFLAVSAFPTTQLEEWE